MKKLEFKVTDILYVDEDENVYEADQVQGLPDIFECLIVEIEDDADDQEIEYAIKIEIDDYLLYTLEMDFKAYQFTYEETNNFLF